MRSPALAMAFLVAVAPAVAVAQAAEDGWDVTDNVPGATIASVRFEGGTGLTVQCRAGQLAVAVLGLPPAQAPQGSRVLDTGFDPEAMDSATWQTTDRGAVAVSPWPAKRARELRKGGVFIVRTETATGGARLELPLPADPAGLDRVLTDCGRPLSDPRDDLPSAGGFLVSPNWAPRPPAFDAPVNGRAEMTCIIAPRGRVRDCRIESETPAGRGIGAALLRDTNDVRLNFGDNADAAVGRILLLSVSSGRTR